MRRAFTVVELLVVIAIIGVLMAIAIPAVQRAREAARRTQCSAYLKQIATATLTHNTAFENFPNAGGRGDLARSLTSGGGPKRAVEQDWGVFYQILPYLEQKNTYEATTDAEAAGLKLKVYFCPTRRPPTAVTVSSTLNGLPAGTLRGGVDYAGSGGTLLYNGSPAAQLGGQTGVIIPRPNIPGVGNYNELISTSAIRDGQSNVLMFGERNYNRKPPTSPQSDEDNGYFNGWSHDTIRWSSQNPPYPDRIASPSGVETRFGGPHSGVVVMALCDGSVRSMRYGTMDQITFKQLTHRADGKNPQLP